MNTTRLIGRRSFLGCALVSLIQKRVPSLEVVVHVGEDERLLELRVSHGTDNRFPIRKLTNLSRSRRHELSLSEGTILSDAADKGLCDARALDSDGACDDSEDAERNYDENEVIEPGQALAHELSRELLSE